MSKNASERIITLFNKILWFFSGHLSYQTGGKGAIMLNRIFQTKLKKQFVAKQVRGEICCVTGLYTSKIKHYLYCVELTQDIRYQTARVEKRFVFYHLNVVAAILFKPHLDWYKSFGQLQITFFWLFLWRPAEAHFDQNRSRTLIKYISFLAGN